MQDALDSKSKATLFKTLAISLLKKHSTNESLDPKVVLEKLPSDWELVTSDFNLAAYLSTVFDHLLTVQENSKVSKNLSKIELLNKENELNTMKCAYVSVNSDRECQVCKSKLQPT
jgi:hypothetical protein